MSADPLDEPKETDPLFPKPHVVDDASQIVSERPRVFAMIVMCYVTFMCEISLGIAVPSLLAFCRRVGSDEVGYGWAMAMFSAGRVIGNPIVGYWGDRRTIKEAMLGSMMGVGVFNIVYAVSPHIALIIVARFLMGVCSGALSLPRMYLRRTSAPHLRTFFVTFNTAMQFAGAFIGPGFGALAALVPLPAGMMGGLMVGGMAALAVLLVALSLRFTDALDIATGPRADADPYGDGVPGVRGFWMRWGLGAFWRWFRRDYRSKGVILFVLLNFLQRFLNGLLETAAPIWYQQWSPPSRVEHDVGVFILIVGCVGLVTFVAVAFLSRVLPDWLMMLVGQIITLAGQFFAFPYGGTSYAYWMFVVSHVVCIGVGYPIAHAIVVSAFGKLLPDDGKEGIYMGLLGAFGSLGRVVSSVLIGGLLKDAATRLTNALGLFVGEIAVFFTFVVLTTAFYGYIRSLPLHRRLEER